MYAPDDMEHFKGRGIYTCTSSGKANHAITVIGFGQQGGTPYWLIRNSWGKNVGDKGYYKIRMTDNGIEDCVIRQKVVWVVRRNEIETVNKTMVIETIKKICFSLKAVERCPRGTMAEATEI
uniref:Peptidase C1A papain C-terminal domain-containing protein n=1 Tax=Panagrolaimus davidi TaxID=227884 RepID=A0A914PYZ4_9BILA